MTDICQFQLVEFTKWIMEKELDFSFSDTTTNFNEEATELVNDYITEQNIIIY